MGSAPSELSMVSTTSARPSGGRPDVPAKMTSSIFPPRSELAPCSPITQASASTTFDLPEPLGPTMQVMPGSSWSVVEDAKDLNPFRVRLFRYTRAPSSDLPPPRRVTAVERTRSPDGLSWWFEGVAGDPQQLSPYLSAPTFPRRRTPRAVRARNHSRRPAEPAG